MMTVLEVIEDDMLRLICGYTPQSRSLEENSIFIMSWKVSGICMVQVIWL